MGGWDVGMQAGTSEAPTLAAFSQRTDRAFCPAADTVWLRREKTPWLNLLRRVGAIRRSWRGSRRSLRWQLATLAHSCTRSFRSRTA